jgi:site-specific DNA-methyltransferase (adenine-specific)
VSVRILIGDCVQRMGDLPDASVDSCVCDPPYHLTSITKRVGKSGAAPIQYGSDGAFQRVTKGFMGQTWDGGDVAFRPETWAEVMRVLKPGAHLIAFSGTRTYHRMVCAIEDAGFEIRDQLAWIYGSGFPKSHDLGDGWGTALKPAWEPVCLARKALIGTNARNLAEHGVGGLNIDGCRIEGAMDGVWGSSNATCQNGRKFNASPDGTEYRSTRNDLGRWPANIIHDGSDEAMSGFPETGPGWHSGESVGFGRGPRKAGAESRDREDEGSAARYFYCAKASTEERGEGNNHPTVKPVALMRWLTRLVTPKGGIVLDPFMGSGSTALACDAEQFNFIGCELSPEYAEIARNRIAAAAGMFADISVEHAPDVRAA